MLTTLEMNEVKQYVLRELPRVLEQDPQFITFINGMFNGRFPTHDEFAHLLDEVKLLREQTYQRFEQIDQRFEQIDQRFEKIDQRFEQVDQRFEKVDQRFEQIDQRFEKVDQQLQEAKRDRLYMKRDIAKLQAGQERLFKKMDSQEAWFKLILGEIRREKGKAYEDIFAAGLSYGLKDHDITPDKIQLRQKLVDTDGLVFKVGYKTEVDIVAEDGKLIVFEVKTTARPGDIDIFAWKVELVTHQNPDKTVEGVFVSLAAEPDIRERCQQYNLRLIE